MLILILASCKKESAPGDGKTKSIEVVEYKTNKPIARASVDYYKVCDFGSPPYCYQLVQSTLTNTDGMCEIPESVFNNFSYGIVISPPPFVPGKDYIYWAVGSEAVHSTATKYALPMVGEEKMHLSKTNDFANGYYIEIKAHGELASFSVIDVARVYAFPSDSSFNFWTYRAQTNTITWNIFDSTDTIISSGVPITVDFPKTGIHEIELKY
jgi:hypothetical protein